MIVKLGFILLLTVFGCSHAHKAHHHHHHDGKTSTENNQRLKLNNGAKWVPDAIMRENMDSMHTGLLQIFKKDRSGNISQKDYQQFNQLVSTSTETIISNCKMSPQMDDVYHVILERMLEANEKLNDVKLQKEATREFVSAFMDYQKYFDHQLKH